MELPINQFKKALQGTVPQYGLWMGLPDTICAEIGAGAGFDWVLIDAEHAPFELRDIHDHLQAIAPYGVPALVRPAEGTTAVIKQLLDIGAQTLLIPMVNTPEQACKLVSDTRYPPQGVRGLGTSMSRAAHWNGIAGYLQRANEEICLIVQAETVQAMDSLPQIAAVEGVDGVFIGPSDLSASMGYPGQPDHPDVVAAIERGIDIIVGAGKAAGILAVNPKMAEHFVKKGARFVGVGVDVGLFAAAVRQLAVSCKQGDISDVESAGY